MGQKTVFQKYSDQKNAKHWAFQKCSETWGLAMAFSHWLFLVWKLLWLGFVFIIFFHWILYFSCFPWFVWFPFSFISIFDIFLTNFFPIVYQLFTNFENLDPFLSIFQTHFSLFLQFYSTLDLQKLAVFQPQKVKHNFLLIKSSGEPT